MTVPWKRILRQSLSFFIPTVSSRQFDILAHSRGVRKPQVPCTLVPDLSPTEKDVAIARRLLEAYRRATSRTDGTGTSPHNDVWSEIRRYQSRFFSLLEEGHPEKLAGYLCNMCRQDATMGVVQGDREFERLSWDKRYRDFVAELIKDKLVSLAEALGTIGCENPEQGGWGESLHCDIDALVSGMAKALGMDLTPPPIDGGLLKVRAAGGLYHERDANAIYTAYLLRQFAGRQREWDICEIGAGVGRVAYWSSRMGFSSYHIFDLPHVNVLQGFYLLKALPDVEVSLFGESPSKSQGRGIRILPNVAIDETEADRFDLVLNQDSFPEIDRGAALRYLAWIRKTSRQYFLSINHESRAKPENAQPQGSVPELAKESGGYALQSRMPYWLRRGYAVELYKTR